MKYQKENWFDYGSEKTSRMHDIMQDLCTLEAREENSAKNIQQHDSNMTIPASASIQHLGTNQSRKIVIHPGCELDCNTAHCVCAMARMQVANPPWVEKVHSHLHSLLCLGGTLSISALCSNNFRMLKSVGTSYWRWV